LRPCVVLFALLALLPAALANGVPNFTTYRQADGLVGDVVSVIAANAKDVYVNSWYPTTSGANGGISTYSFKTDNWTSYGRDKGLVADVLQGLGLDPQGNLWICHAFGVQVFDTAKREFIAGYGPDQGLLGAAEDVAFDGDNLVWVGTSEGMGRFDRSKNEWKMFTTADGLVSNKVFTIAVDGELLWIGTGSGASRFDTGTGEWKSYTTSDGLADDIVNKIVVTDKYVWLATRSGLSRLDKKKGKVRNYGKADGLPSSNVVDVVLFRGRVWVATSDGVGKYEGRWKIVDEGDGLPVTKVNCLAAQKDYIWFGTPSGIARYGPLGPGLSFGSPYSLIVVVGVILGVVLIVLRPGARKAKEEVRRKKPEEGEAAPTRKPPYDICGGVPQRQLCTRCKYYTLKGSALSCAKYKIPIAFPDEGEGKRLRQISKGPPEGKPDQKEQDTPKEN